MGSASQSHKRLFTLADSKGRTVLLDEGTIRRLAFIRYLHDTAVEQSQRPEPMCSSAILTFHDSVELFLQLGSEHLGISRKADGLMGYWQIFKDERAITLSQKASIRRLNRARASLKHHGTLPSKLAIEGFRASVTNFFDENTPLVFNHDLSEISLVELIDCEDARNSVKDAETLLEKGKYDDAVDKVAIAFAQLIDDYEDRKRDQFGRSPFFFGRSVTSVGRAYIRGRSVKMIPDEIIESIEALQDAVKIVSLGIDYRRYVRFRLLTPIILRLGSPSRYHIQGIGTRETTIEDIRFCIDFVIESAVTLQEFDF